VVQVARPAVRLEVEAVVQDQLMRVGLEYWEGAVDVRGDVRGRGYLEMTGYPPSR
jgi:predicted secreted hydrolase